MSLFDTDVAPAVAEARLLHPQDYGFFTVAAVKEDGSWKEDHFPMSRLDAVSHSLRGNADTYMSQASFATKLRRGFNTKALRCVFVDLDTYNLPGDQDPQALAGQVIERARSAGIPDPSYIASSGRGLYAKWVFDNPVNAGLLPSWKLLQKKLVSTYLPMGADPKVVDPTRVLRLQETVNRKSASQVELISQGSTHSFAELFRQTERIEILRRQKDGSIVKARETVVHKGRKISAADLVCDEALTDLDGLNLYSGVREPAMMAQRGLQSLNWSRFLDLRDLVISRGGVRRGSRDMILFWMVSFLAHAKIITPENFWTEVQALLASFPVSRDFNPMQDGSLSTLFERIKSQAQGHKVVIDGQSFAPIYTPTNDTLINMLQISPEEEGGLRTIISTGEKRDRADAKAPGRASRRTERRDMREAAVEMHAQGMTQSEIAGTMGKSRSTISRWLTQNEGVGLPYVETRGRRRPARSSYPAVAITGRGAIDSHTGLPWAPDQSPGNQLGAAHHHTAKKALSKDELRARTRIRQPKPHLCPKRTPWPAGQISLWLEQRNLVLSRRAHCVNPIFAAASEASIEAQADILVSALMANLRRPREESTRPISISSLAPLSCNPTTGPPANDTV